MYNLKFNFETGIWPGQVRLVLTQFRSISRSFQNVHLPGFRSEVFDFLVNKPTI